MRKSVCLLSLLFVGILSSFLWTGCASTSSKSEDYVYTDPYTVKFGDFEKVTFAEEPQEFIISPDGNSKKAMKNGEIYDFLIGPYNTSNIILAFHNSSGINDWNILPNDGNNYFKLRMQVPEDATQLMVGSSSTGYSWGGTISVLPVDYSKNSSFNSITKKDGVSRVILQKTQIGEVKGNVFAGEFCQFDIGPSESPYCIISMEINKKSNVWIPIENDGSNYFTTLQLIPENIKSIHIAFSDTNDFYKKRAYKLNVKKSKNPYEFKYTDSYKSKLNEFKSAQKEDRVIKFMESIDARNLAKTDPDAVIEKTVEYILSISRDDFTTVKYIHDAEWYLVSYDDDALYNEERKSQDYKTVISTGLAVCAGFSTVFSQFCKVAGINEIPVSGYARGIGWGGQHWSKEDDPTKTNHAWNMVNLYGFWYLLDVTWDCGSTKHGQRNDYYSTIWLFADPEAMIHSHFPANMKYQLLDNPYNAKEFKKLDYLTPR